MLVVWGNGAIAISLDFRALFYYDDYFIVIGGLASVIGINLNIYIAEMYLQISSVSGRWCVRLGLAWAIVGSAVAFGSTALAQVVPDNTVGSAVSGISGGEQTITGGTRQGGNLFHSFERFSVPTNGAAIFRNDLDIQNILSRVTGGSVSDIDGLIQANGTANLFLLNPNGIVFGQNARLDVGGSFIATTASSINFADGTQFSATPGTGAPLLTVSVPLGLQFGAGAGNIVNRSRAVDSNNFPVGLQVDPGKTLGLIGGNVSLEGSRLTARGGRVELGAVAAPGFVGISPDSSGFRFSFPTDLALGDISLTADTTVSPTRPAFVNVRSGGSGSIAVNAGNLNLFGGSELLAGISGNQGSASAVAGDIVINAQGSVTIDGLGQFPERFFSSGIYNSVEEGGTGKGGDVNIKASSLFLRDRAVIAANTTGQGDAGNIQITVTDLNDSVLLEGESFIQTDSFSTTGSAGNISITASGKVVLDGESEVTSSLRQPEGTPQTNRRSGDISIKARSLSLANGSQVGASTFSQGNAGNITLEIGEAMTIGGAGTTNTSRGSGVFSNVQGGSGKNGTINVMVGSLSIASDGVITASTLSGEGEAGNISIIASGDLSLDEGIVQSTYAGTSSVQGNRKGGDINIKARSLSLTKNASIRTSTLGQGDAGNISVKTERGIFLSNSNIFNNVEAGAVGNGGTIDINAESLTLADGSQIQALVRDGGRGDGGKIVVDVRGSFDASGRNRVGDNAGNPSRVSTIVSDNAQGKGGDIDIKAGTLSFRDTASIIASVFGVGDAGKINIAVSNTATFSGVDENFNFASGIFSEVIEGKGGDINIKARSLSLTDGAQLTTSTFGQGNAGNIQITATDPNNSVFIDGYSTINATSSSIGNSGNIQITADGSISLDQGSQVNGSLLKIQPDSTGQIPPVPGDRKGGDINIKARALSLKNGAQIGAATVGSQGNAGNIKIDVSNTISIDGLDSNNEFASGIFSTIQNGGKGKGGNINVNSGTLALTNGGTISASTLAGEGDAGDITITVRSLDLDRGEISATSSSDDGGNIQLQIDKRLTLRNGSQISTTAGTAQQPGDGGNITINSPLIIAALVNEFNQDSDITANAFTGTGGNIKITSQGIFGIQPRREATLDTNDITASSELGIGGRIQINSLEIDPSRDIVELPTGLVDASSLVASGCPSGAENRFTVAGRGGLPPAPADKLSSDALLTDWATLQTPETQNRAAVETTLPVATNTTPTPPVKTITEATSWQYDRNGAIILTSGDTTSSSHLKTTPTSCPSS